ncbi:MAG: HEAT repeat domain-containing protein [Spirochaetaceae bacterium]|nr:MAG: HEAT repeat domain-containing protein [Spirochaetaceae bacterium]
MKRIIYALAFISICSGVCLAEEKTTDQIFAEWRQTLQYGIDSEVIAVVKKLQERGDERLNTELVSVLGRSLSAEVRRVILEFFTKIKYDKGAEAAHAILANYDNEEPELLRQILLYLLEIKYEKAVDIIIKLVDSDNILLAGSAIRAVGKLGTDKAGELLLEKLRDPEMQEDRKPDIILALGDVKSQAAVDELISIVDNTDQNRLWRMYASESLGKIGNPKAIPILKKIFLEKDPLVKASATAALGYFHTEETVDILIEALKESHWKVREAACAGLSFPGAAKAVPILIYKVEKDPEQKIRMDAATALGKIGTTEAADFLRQYFLKKENSVLVREIVFYALVDGHLRGETIRAIEQVIKAESAERDKKMVDIISRKLASTESGELRSIYTLFIENPYFVLRISGIRGIAKNRYTDMRPRVEKMATDDASEIVRNEAKSALDKF